MMSEERAIEMSADEQALDAALVQTLRAPTIPAGFRDQLNAALLRAAEDEHFERRRLDSERREWLAKFELDYLRLRRRTLGTLIGGAFAAGVAVMSLLPWFNATFGTHALFAMAAAGALVGLAIGAIPWLRHLSFRNPLEML